jgi:predicted ribonuclease YlaK
MSEEVSIDNMNSEFLDKMLNAALKAAENDVAEAQKHVDAVKEKIEKDPENARSLHTFAIMYQEALRVKGIARDRHIKIVRMIQDRVRLVELAKTAKGGVPWLMTPEAIQQLLEKAGEEKSGDE